MRCDLCLHFWVVMVFGIVMARLIEFPVLRMRERFFPPEQTAVASPAAGSTYEALVPAKKPED